MITSIFEAYDARVFTIFPLYFPWSIVFIFLLYWIGVYTHQTTYSWGGIGDYIIFHLKANYLNFRGRPIRGLKFLLGGVFLSVIWVNIWGLIPYIFSCRRHIYWTLTIGFPVWLTFLAKSLWENSYFGWRYFLPAFCRVGGQPQYGIIASLVFLECISLLIQPVTLSIRLVANVGAGHLVLGLASSVLVSRSQYFSKTIIFFLIIGYAFFEIAVNVLQAYIFFILLLSYSSLNVELTVK